MGFMPRPRKCVWGAPHQKAVIPTAWLGVWILLTSGQGSVAEVVTAVVAQSATLNAPVTAGVFSFAWYRGTSVNDDTLKIFSYITSSGLQTPGDQYTGRQSALANGSLHITGLRTSDSGNYTALAILANTGSPVVGLPQQLWVLGTDPPPPPDNIGGLSVGAIVGIVVGVLAAIIIVCVLVYIFVIKKPASGAAAAGDSTEMAPNNNEVSASPKANGTAAEIQYSSVNFVPKRGTPAKPVSPENTVYSEVRR